MIRRTALACAALASLAALPVRAQIRFGSPSAYAPGTTLTSLATGDFDEDGRLDLVAPNGAPGNILMLRGNGNGGFFEPSSFPSGAFPVAIVAADLNGDRHLDAAVANRDGGDVSILLGDGAGSLGAPARFAVGTGPTALASGDLDEDGLVDLVVADGGGNTTILLGTGAGGFRFGGTLAVNVGSVAILVGDLDNDRHLDLVIAGRGTVGGRVDVCWGNGLGGFPAQTTFSPLDPRGLALSDFDLDGFVDIAVANFHSFPAANLLLNDGVRGFRFVWCSNLEFGNAVAAADFDEDGWPDLAVSFDRLSLLDIRPGDGTGHCGYTSPLTPFPGTGNGLLAADFDGDGRIDLAGADSIYGNGVVVVLNETLDPIACRRGNVNAIAGGVADVLRVNGFAGEGLGRTLLIDRAAPLDVRLDAPPLNPRGPAAFVLYGWPAWPEATTVRELPHGVGLACLPTPLDSAALPQPVAIWNNLGRARVLGRATRPSSAAPSIVLALPGGIGRPGRGFLQGLIVDYASPQGLLAVTNGIAVESR